MEAFHIAECEALEPFRRNFIILVLKDKLHLNEFPRDIRYYIKQNTHIDVTDGSGGLLEILRCVKFVG